MIITKTPYRVSFFGGGSDYPQWYRNNGGEVISTTINKYVYISIRELNNFFFHKHRISYSQIEEVTSYKQIRHNVVRNALLDKKELIKEMGLEIHYDGDLPARSGMGSSSTFLVGFLKALDGFFNSKKISKKNLAIESLNFEQNILKENVGSQDQIAATYGGFNNIIFKKNGHFEVKNFLNEKEKKIFCKNFFLILTGFTRTGNEFSNSNIMKLNNEKKENIAFSLELLNKAKAYLKKKDYISIGNLLHKSWIEKKKLSNIVSNNTIDDLYELGIKRGALGGKLLGAGGGGFLLFFVPQKKRKDFYEFFRKKNLILPLETSSSGSEIIYHEKKS